MIINQCTSITGTRSAILSTASVAASATPYQIVAIGGGASAHASTVVLEFIKKDTNLVTEEFRFYAASCGSAVMWFGAAGPVTSEYEQARVTTHLKGVGTGFSSANLIYRIIL